MAFPFNTSGQLKSKMIDFNYPQDVSKEALADLDYALKEGRGQLTVDALVRYSIAQSGISEENMGDIIGDISSRRGKIEGSDIENGAAIIRGFVPLSEMFGYATDLRSRTQGRGTFTMQFDHYEPVPKNMVEKITGRKDY